MTGSDNLGPQWSVGHCHSLAIAIHQRTGHELGVVREKPGSGKTTGPIVHVYARIPGGKALDAEGLHDESDMPARWADRSRSGQPYTAPTSVSSVKRSLPLKPDPEAAGPTADHLIRTYL